MRPRHHTLPQMYLRNFGDKSEQVRLVRRDPPYRTHLSAIHNAVAEAGFYRIESEELAREEDRESFDPESIEAALSGIEAAAQSTVQQLIAHGLEEFTDQNRYRLTQFAAVQTVRGNRWRQVVSNLVTAAVYVDRVASLPPAEGREWLRKVGASDVAELLGLLEARKLPRLIPPKPVLVQESLKMAIGGPDSGDGSLQFLLYQKRIELIRPSRVRVLTSDEPVCWWSPSGPSAGYAGARLVWLPLSPELIVQFRDSAFDPCSSGLPADGDALAEFVNAQVAGQAHRWIVQHSADPPFSGLTASAAP